MLLSTGLLVLVLVHLKASAEPFFFTPFFQQPRYLQRFPQMVVPPGTGVVYLIGRQIPSAAATRNEFISSKSENNNEIAEEEHDFKLKPSELLLSEDLEAEPDYAAIFRDDNETEVTEKVNVAPINERTRERSSVTRRGEARADNGNGGNGRYRNRDAWSRSSGSASSGDWELGDRRNE